MRVPGAALVLCLSLLAVPLAGCGGGDGGYGITTSAAPSPAQQAKQPTTQEQAPRQEQSAKPKPAGEARQHTPVGDPTPGAKAIAPGVPVVKDGDNSIQSFGAEGEEGERTQAIRSLSAYLRARAAGEWARACALASQEFREQLEKLVANARVKGDAKKPQGCAATLRLLTPGPLRGSLRASAQVAELLSFRAEGAHAYLIYKGVGGETMFIAMANEEGKWKVNVLQPERFSEPTRGKGQGQ